MLASSNNGLGHNVREQSDRREARADLVVATLVDGEPVSRSLADLGVRWVVMLKTVGFEQYGSLFRDPGLESVVDSPDIAAFRVSVPVATHRDRRWRLGAIPSLVSQLVPPGVALALVARRHTRRSHPSQT